MYLAHYNLKEKPFSISPDSRFLWLSEKHKEALANLKYGVMENKGFLVLTGDIGTGKTLLINALIRITGVNALIATLPDPDLEIMDFFNLLSNEFNMNKVFISKGDFLIEFRQFLLESYASQKVVLLIIDEAQRLNHELLEQIRLLSNIELGDRKLINIFFVGQSEFNQLIRDDRNRAVRQRVSVNFQLEPLSKPETVNYIHHRLKKAGAAKEIFKPDAAREVFNFSRGYPRLINVICDLALVTGYTEGLKKIGAGVIKECEKELKIPINMEAPQKDQSTLRRSQHKTDITAPRPKQPSGFRYGLAFIIALFMAFIGYQIYDSFTQSSSRWQQDDFASQQNNRLLEKQREAFKAEIEKETMIKEGDSIGKNASQDKAEINTNAIASLSIEESKKETVNSENSLKRDLSDSQPSGFVSGQKSIIYFKHNSNELTQQAYETLNNVIQFTVQHPNLTISVEGFTDSHGDAVYNKQLSKYRADIVKSYLIGQGISASRINSVGRGPENPLKSNESLEGREKNRRVEIKFDSQ
ncbi:MAG: OmpA family protein [Desulfobacterales bacterium]|jgi:general secretion pathway protein A